MEAKKWTRPLLLVTVAAGLLVPCNNEGRATLGSGGELLVHPEPQPFCDELLARDFPTYQPGESCEVFFARLEHAYSTVWDAAKDFATTENGGETPDGMVITEVANRMLAGSPTILEDVLGRMEAENTQLAPIRDMVEGYGYWVPSGDIATFDEFWEAEAKGVMPQVKRDIFLAQVAATGLEREEIADIVATYVARTIGS